MFVLNRYFPKSNGFLRSRAEFFTDDAGYPFGIGQAAIAVDKGQADDGGLFRRDGQALYGAGGADLPAEGAIVFAIADTGDQPWCK